MKKRMALGLLLVLVFAVNTISMPRRFYSGDAFAARAGAAHFINTGRFGIEFTERDQIADLLDEKGQYLFNNDEQARFYSKYGMVNSALFFPPLLLEKLVVGRLGLITKTRSLLLYLNLYFVLLSLLIAFYLFRLASLYTARPWVALAFALACLYGTFLWNYLRAQTFEIFQVLFFVMLAYHWIVYWRTARCSSPQKGHLLLALGCAVIFSCLKAYHALIFPVFLAAWAVEHHDTKEWKLGWREPTWILAAAACTGIIVMLANQAQFGGLLEFGYFQWQREGQLFHGFAWQNLRDAVPGFVLRENRSVFLHFPLLLLAIFGSRVYAGKHSYEALFLGLSFVTFFLFVSASKGWEGQACYGPRYLLPFLPALSLPAISWLDGTFDSTRKPMLAKSCQLAVLICLLASAKIQWSVNRLDFFASYHIHGYFVQGYFKDIQVPSVEQYFDHHLGIIFADLAAYRDGESTFPPVEMLKQVDSVPEEKLNQLQSAIRSHRVLRPNFYFFP